MKGEFISVETARINADIEKENKELQQENQNLKNVIKNSYQKRIDELQKQIEKLEEDNEHNYRYARKYGLRIDKAIEYINKNKDNLFLDSNEEFLSHDELIDKEIGNNLLNILEGKDE